MTTDAELDAEEAELNTVVAEANAKLQAAKTRLNALAQERLVLHKAEHLTAYQAARDGLQALINAVKGLIHTSNDPVELRDAARKLSNAGYELSNLFYKAHAGEERHWDSPENRVMEKLSSAAEQESTTADSLSTYLTAAAGATGARKELFAKTAASIRRNGASHDEGGLPCTYCGEPKWGYNDEGYECRNCY